VNYNTCELVREMLGFLRSSALPFSYKLVVVDNKSKDDSHEFLSTQDDILYIQAGENLGYGRAINRGIQAVESRYVHLNTDVLNREALVTLRIQDKIDVGVVAPRQQKRFHPGFIYYRQPLPLCNILNRIRTSWIGMRLAHIRTNEG
jgi:GT2 family glycosyltransferase